MKTKLVNLTSCLYYKAILLKSRLEAEGIEAYLANVNLIQSDIASGVNVLVKDSDLKKALQLMHSLDNEVGKDEKILKKKAESINKIICPVDFSDDSLNAAHFALWLAVHLKAEVKFVYTYNPVQPMANVFPDSFSYQIEMGNILEDDLLISKQKMQKFKEGITDYVSKKLPSKVKFSTHLIANDPFRGIPAFCKKFKSAMVVMGTKGLGKSKNYVAGSVALNTIEKVNIPVMVIPKDFKFAAVENFNIIYLTDFDEKDFSSFRKLMSIAGIFNPEIHCVHLEHEKSVVSQVMLDELTDKLKDIYSSYRVDCTLIKSHDAPKSINSFIKSKGVNLLAMSEKKRNFLFQFFNKSFIKEMLFNVNVPLLVFKY
ncbi:MAG: universal stress protein [Bacteroidota bacterium]